MKITSEHIANDQSSSNLSNNQRRGLASLRKRCKDGSLVVRETDKTKKLTAMTRDNYIASTEPHTIQDKVISARDESN